jgi:hypothetical protein
VIANPRIGEAALEYADCFAAAVAVTSAVIELASNQISGHDTVTVELITATKPRPW